MAEFVMKDLSRKAGLEEALRIASAATSTEEIGNPVYPPARRKLAEHQISCAGKTARQLRREDYQEYDFLVGMDPCQSVQYAADAGRGSGGEAVPAAGPRRAFGGGDRRSLVYWGL